MAFLIRPVIFDAYDRSDCTPEHIIYFNESLSRSKNTNLHSEPWNSETPLKTVLIEMEARGSNVRLPFDF